MTINQEELNTALKSRLHSRMIQYSAFTFADGSASVIVTLRTTTFNVNIPYLLSVDGDMIAMSTHSATLYAPTVNDAIGKLVKEMRTMEVKFSRWKK